MKRLFYAILIILIYAACNTGGSNSHPSSLDAEQTTKSGELLSILKSRKEKGIMLGHQDALAYGSMWYGDVGRSDVKSVCGDYPALVGWDIGNIELGANLNVDSVEFKKIEEYIKTTHERGGISMISWTANNPIRNNNEHNVVSAILNQKQYKQKYLTYLDHLATFFTSLKDKKGNLIPIVFRPFYAPNKNGNWWSSEFCSCDDYKQLWKITVDYLRKEKKVKNLLWAFSLYNPLSSEEILKNYPGDEYVDIIGSDLYLEQKEDLDGKMYMAALDKNLALITEISNKKNKIAALTETGMEGIKIPNYFSKLVYPIISKYSISYILFGKNSWNIENYYHIPIPGHPASEDFFRFAKAPRILTCNKLDNK